MQENSEKKKVASLVQILKVQQNIFEKCFDSSEQAVEVNFEISHLIVKSSRSCVKGNCLKNCLFVVSLKLSFTNYEKKV
jgi:hypothetical protein